MENSFSSHLFMHSRCVLSADENSIMVKSRFVPTLQEMTRIMVHCQGSTGNFNPRARPCAAWLVALWCANVKMAPNKHQFIEKSSLSYRAKRNETHQLLSETWFLWAKNYNYNFTSNLLRNHTPLFPPKFGRLFQVFYFWHHLIEIIGRWAVV